MLIFCCCGCFLLLEILLLIILRSLQIPKDSFKFPFCLPYKRASQPQKRPSIFHANSGKWFLTPVVIHVLHEMTTCLDSWSGNRFLLSSKIFVNVAFFYTWHGLLRSTIINLTHKFRPGWRSTWNSGGRFNRLPKTLPKSLPKTLPNSEGFSEIYWIALLDSGTELISKLCSQAKMQAGIQRRI